MIATVTSIVDGRFGALLEHAHARGLATREGALDDLTASTRAQVRSPRVDLGASRRPERVAPKRLEGPRRRVDASREPRPEVSPRDHFGDTRARRIPRAPVFLELASRALDLGDEARFFGLGACARRDRGRQGALGPPLLGRAQGQQARKNARAGIRRR